MLTGARQDFRTRARAAVARAVEAVFQDGPTWAAQVRAEVDALDAIAISAQRDGDHGLVVRIEKAATELEFAANLEYAVAVALVTETGRALLATLEPEGQKP